VLLILGISFIVVAICLGLYICKKKANKPKQMTKQPKRGKYKFIEDSHEEEAEE